MALSKPELQFVSESGSPAVRQYQNAPKYPDYEDEVAREATFVNWQSKIAPCKLYPAGFFNSGEGDTATTYCCGLALAQWRKRDDPMRIHAEHSPWCFFIMHRVQTYGQDHDVRCVGQDSFDETIATQMTPTGENGNGRELRRLQTENLEQRATIRRLMDEKNSLKSQLQERKSRKVEVARQTLEEWDYSKRQIHQAVKKFKDKGGSENYNAGDLLEIIDKELQETDVGDGSLIGENGPVEGASNQPLPGKAPGTKYGGRL